MTKDRSDEENKKATDDPKELIEEMGDKLTDRMAEMLKAMRSGVAAYPQIEPTPIAAGLASRVRPPRFIMLPFSKTSLVINNISHVVFNANSCTVWLGDGEFNSIEITNAWDIGILAAHFIEQECDLEIIDRLYDSEDYKGFSNVQKSEHTKESELVFKWLEGPLAGKIGDFDCNWINYYEIEINSHQDFIKYMNYKIERLPIAVCRRNLIDDAIFEIEGKPGYRQIELGQVAIEVENKGNIEQRKVKLYYFPEKTALQCAIDGFLEVKGHYGTNAKTTDEISYVKLDDLKKIGFVL